MNSRKSPRMVDSQSARFIEAAKKAESDLSGKEFEKAFKKIVKKKKPREVQGS
jgi:hypothetical protein